jgi:hypothetical protein
MAAARRWFRFTESCSLLRFDPALVEEASKNDQVVYGVGRLDAYYFRNRTFLRENQLLQGVGRIEELPGTRKRVPQREVTGSQDDPEVSMASARLVCKFQAAHTWHQQISK